jgi:enoyl-CoA hydratase/carnithine racemase
MGEPLAGLWPPPLPASLQVELQGAILRVRLVRPAKRNALDDPTIAGLQRCFESVPESVRVAVLLGEGAHFCAGLDLAELQARDVAAGIAHSLSWHRAFAAIQFGRVPVIAVLRGAVIGGGLELAAAAHIRIAEAGAFFALPEGQRGIFVGGGGSVRLPRLIGVARMLDMMLTGRRYEAADALAIGLAQYLVAEGEGEAKALALAESIAGNAPLTNFAVLHALPRIAAADPEIGFLTEALMAAIAQGEPAAKERLAAFLAGRDRSPGGR